MIFDELKKLPMMALRGVVVIPGEPTHFDVGREKSVLALREALSGDHKIFLVTQKDVNIEDPTVDDLYRIGVIATVDQMLKGADHTIRVLATGLERAELIDMVNESCLKAVVTPEHVSEISGLPQSEKAVALLRSIKEAFAHFSTAFHQIPKELEQAVADADIDDLGGLINLILSRIPFSFEDKQTVLEEYSLEKQAQLLTLILEREARIFTYENEIYAQVRANIDDRQREVFLREQMHVLSEQLGEGEEDAEVAEYERRIRALKNISDESREKLLKETERLNRLPVMSQEAAVITTYLDTCLDLPWDHTTKDKTDLKAARAKLDRDHDGMQKVKERILEALAVRKLSPEMRGQILCLVGPPGVGKTSIARSVAEAMGRQYVRISLGGVRDESDIRGHRKTYIGSMPGRIITALTQAKSRNPLMLLDEIDKMGNDFKGDPASAMLEVLDSEQNFAFRDHYIELPFDLSEVFFITTANTVDTIPAPLLDRMEIIELSSYTREEKFRIAKKHLVKKQRQKHGLTHTQFRLTDGAIYGIIDGYTREAGVRKLERQIATLCRKTVKEVVEDGSTPRSITADRLESYLGSPKYRPETVEDRDRIGLVNGLAWTATGGEMLQIEVSVLDGSGKLELTGSLGDVMKESAKTAVSYVRSVAKDYGIDTEFYKNKDIHIHLPEGAVPKDGPSAGVTLVTALLSALCGAPFRHDCAMTGEVTLRGRVLEIGGLREKCMAAYRAGVTTIFLPKGNLPDLSEVDDVVKSAIRFVPCDHVSQILKETLLFSQSTNNHRQPVAEERSEILLPLDSTNRVGGQPLNCNQTI